jgi:RNA polymerase sigma-70 factor (ECF subfamily)
LPDSVENNERDLMRQVVIGNENAFAQLFHAYKDKLYSFILCIAESNLVAEDIVQDVFLKIWQKREDLENIQHFNAYLFRMAHNHAVNLMKRKAKEKLILAELERDDKKAKEIDNEIDFKEVEKFFHEAIENLPQRQKQVFILSREHGLKQEEIAQQLNVSVTTVKAHMKLALRSIRQQCKDAYPSTVSYLILIIASFLLV